MSGFSVRQNKRMNDPGNAVFRYNIQPGNQSVGFDQQRHMLAYPEGCKFSKFVLYLWTFDNIKCGYLDLLVVILPLFFRHIFVPRLGVVAPTVDAFRGDIRVVELHAA